MHCEGADKRFFSREHSKFSFLIYEIFLSEHKFATLTSSIAAARIRNARLTAPTVSANTDVSADTTKTVFTETSTRSIPPAKLSASILGLEDVSKMKSQSTTFASGTRKIPGMDLATGVLDQEMALVKALAKVPVIPGSISAIEKTRRNVSRSSASCQLAFTITTTKLAAFATKEHTIPSRTKLASRLWMNAPKMPTVKTARSARRLSLRE